MAGRIRLDLALEQRGLVQSRARARDAILRGTVTVNGAAASKPGALVGGDDSIVVDDPAGDYVSRAALKLIAGLDAGGIEVAGRTCLDLGASTGGFTLVLAARGAAKIYAVDVGHGQLATSRCGRTGVINSGTNGRDLTRATIPEAIDVLVCDVSFVSMTKVLAAPLSLCGPDAGAVILIKPQFEVGRDNIGKGGIVVVDAGNLGCNRHRYRFCDGALGWTHRLSVASPISGRPGTTRWRFLPE